MSNITSSKTIISNQKRDLVEHNNNSTNIIKMYADDDRNKIRNIEILCEGNLNLCKHFCMKKIFYGSSNNLVSNVIVDIKSIFGNLHVWKRLSNMFRCYLQYSCCKRDVKMHQTFRNHFQRISFYEYLAIVQTTCSISSNSSSSITHRIITFILIQT